MPMVQKDGIKIYTIAVGSNTRTRTYLFDSNARDLIRAPNGEPIVRMADYPVDKEILAQISNLSGAQFLKQKIRSLYKRSTTKLTG